MGCMERASDRRVPVGMIVALAAVWLTILVVPPAILLSQRSAWLAALERPEAQAGWDEFRDAMRAKWAGEVVGGCVLRV